MKRKKSLIFAIITIMAVGFAAVSTTLYINGTVGVGTNQDEYEVYYSRALVNGVEDKSVIIDDTHIEFETEMKTIGDKYELEYYITNGSRNYDADVVMTCTDGNDYVKVNNNWVNHTVIDATDTKSGKLTLEMIKGYTGNDPLELKVECEITASAAERDSLGTGTPADKVQQDPAAPVSFADDSWEKIAAAVKTGNYPYQVGDTKTITLASHTNDCSSYSGTGATYVCNSSVEAEKEVTVRVVNTTECTNGETSETACGFVVEIVDIQEKHNYNPADATNTYGTNVGGWKDSAIRTYVNGTLYSALPSELQSVIADTTVVSGHGSTRGETNSTTTDKLYLLSAHEVWNDGTSNAVSSYDTSYNETRQLDYYANLGVTTNNYAGAIKQYNGRKSSWWLRSAYSDDTRFFLYVDFYGSWSRTTASTTCWVSAAFRIA